MTLDDLKRIARYVPGASRHPSATDGALWWPAHEIGHLLTALPDELGLPYFGWDPNGDYDGIQRQALLIECSAMRISHRLLDICGRWDLVQQEAEDTDQDTYYWWGDHIAAVQAFARKRGCFRIPQTAATLEAAAKAKRALMPRRRTSLWVRRAPDQPRYTCDTCMWAAIWCHPHGGLRCRRCPRP